MAYRLSLTPDAADFHFVKSAQFRVVHTDGVWGGVTPAQKLAMGFYSERISIPQLVQYAITKEATLGKELDRQGRTGFVREMEVELVMDKATATFFHEWLGKQLEGLK